MGVDRIARTPRIGPGGSHERRRVSRRSQAGAQGVPRSDTRPPRRDPRDQGLGHVRQRPAQLSRPGPSGRGRDRRHQAGGRHDRRPRALRRRRRGGRRRHREGGPGRPARDGPPLRRLRQLQALPGGLDADVPRGHGGLRLGRARRTRQVHEGAGVDAGAAAGRALLRDGRGDLLRHRHGLGRAEADQSAGRRDDRHLRPGPGGPVGDAARRRHGRARHRHRRRARAAQARPGSSARTR